MNDDTIDRIGGLFLCLLTSAVIAGSGAMVWCGKATFGEASAFVAIFLGLHGAASHVSRLADATKAHVENIAADDRLTMASHTSGLRDAVSKAAESINRVSCATTKDIGPKLDEITTSLAKNTQVTQAAVDSGKPKTTDAKSKKKDR
jgi:hypothetical protein